MSTKRDRLVYSCGVVLLLAAAAKLISAGGTTKILDVKDPLFLLPNRQVFILVGSIELTVAHCCFSPISDRLKHTLVLWLATSFAAYRMGIWWIGAPKPCSCLGSLGDALHLSSDLLNKAMFLVMTYLIAVSLAGLQRSATATAAAESNRRARG